MSAPQALRLAIEACRPTRSTALRLRALAHTRPFSHQWPLHARKHDDKSRDITQGFPMPESEVYEQKHDVEEAPIDIDHISSTAPESSTSTSDPPQRAPEPAIAAEQVNPEENISSQLTPPSQPTRPSTNPVPELTNSPTPALTDADPQDPSVRTQMFPPNVLAAYLAPMRHQPIHGIPVGSLQLRSFSLRNLEFFADFCMRAAFYLNMPARGPVPLPKKIERWTVLKDTFVNKKAQENFERITYKRLITVLDAEAPAVEAWLAFVRKWQFYGVGMKANVWAYEGVDVAKTMDRAYEEGVAEELAGKLGQFGWNREMGQKSSVERLLLRSDKTRNYVGSPMSNVRRGSESGDMREKNLGVI